MIIVRLPVGKPRARRDAQARGGGRGVIRLAIVEDHPAIAEGLTALLRDEPDVTVVGTARDSVAADRLIAAHSPDVILCDIRLAGTVDGLEILARHTPGPAFIMLSAYSYPSYYAAAVERGAKGYLSKMASIEQILTAVRAVAAGDTAFTADVRRAALCGATPADAALVPDPGARGRGPLQRRDLRTPVAPGEDRREPAADVRSLRRDEPDLAVRVAQRQGWIEGDR